MSYLEISTNNFYIKYGCAPTFVYVGRSEMNCIKRHVKDHPLTRDENGVDSLAGLLLIEVDAKNHLNIAGSSLWCEMCSSVELKP